MASSRGRGSSWGHQLCRRMRVPTAPGVQRPAPGRKVRVPGVQHPVRHVVAGSPAHGEHRPAPHLKHLPPHQMHQPGPDAVDQAPLPHPDGKPLQQVEILMVAVHKQHRAPQPGVQPVQAQRLPAGPPPHHAEIPAHQQVVPCPQRPGPLQQFLPLAVQVPCQIQHGGTSFPAKFSTKVYHPVEKPASKSAAPPGDIVFSRCFDCMAAPEGV